VLASRLYVLQLMAELPPSAVVPIFTASFHVTVPLLVIDQRLASGLRDAALTSVGTMKAIAL
jgi:hypothetical protein